jgi:cytidylate kinase
VQKWKKILFWGCVTSASLSLAASLFFFWLFYEFYLKWDFNALGRYFDPVDGVAYTDDAFMFVIPATFFLLLALVLAAIATIIRKRHRAKLLGVKSLPVIAIDGPSASGKGTVAQIVAERLGFHYLDSGALYRIVALAAQQRGISWQDEAGLAAMAPKLHIVFEQGQVLLDDEYISEAIRTEDISRGASEVAVHPALRKALVKLQRSFCKAPGLVADGRDMGSVIFPEARTKIFLTASAEIRAERRYKQLMGKGIHANLAAILQDLQARDARDRQRTVAPLQQCEGALLLDTDPLTIEQAVQQVLNQYQLSLQT